MTRWKMRGLALVILALSLGSCIGTGWVPNRRDSLDEVMWGGLFVSGLVYFIMFGMALSSSFGKRSKPVKDPSGFPSWAGLVVGPLFGAGFGFKAGEGHLVGLVGGAMMGLAAGGCVWFMDFIGSVRFEDEDEVPVLEDEGDDD